MRYLIFNITVLSALGYLFMASPDQSFTNWLGKAPQMFDAARSAGRDASAPGSASETAGTALLEAMEPVIEEVLSPAVQTTADQNVSSKPASGQVAAGQLVADQSPPAVDNDNQPVTMRDIETMIRALLETRTGMDKAADAVNAANSQLEQTPDAGVDKAPLQDQPASADATPKTLTSELAVAAAPAEREPALATAAAGNRSGTAAPAISEEMSDDDIAAAFAKLQQSATGSDVTTPARATADLATTDLATADQMVTAGDGVAVPEAPEYMSPGQRADSLALMVEELQLMYLERTGG